MKTKSLVAAVAAMLLSVPAHAATLFNFSATAASDSVFNFSFSIDDIADLSANEIGLRVGVGDIAVDNGLDFGAISNGFATFVTAASGGGLQLDDATYLYADFSGPQLFSGSVDMPTFLLGNFTLFGSDGNSVGTIAVTSDVAAVPEPASWAMMLVGFGAVGYSLRRRRGAVKFAEAC